MATLIKLSEDCGINRNFQAKEKKSSKAEKSLKNLELGNQYADDFRR